MKVLHILNDGPTQLSDEIISLQAKDHNVKITDSSKRDASYKSIVDDIFVRDRVSW